MLPSIGLLVVGVVLLVAGADRLVSSVSALARRVGISPLVIGMTVVAFGTSAPEIVVNLIAATHGNTALSFGSLVGSCLLNLGVVIGLTAIVKPIVIESKVVLREIPMVILAAACLLVETLDVFDGQPDRIDRTNGLVLLLLFGVFLYYTFLDIWRNRTSDDLAREMTDRNDQPTPTRSVWWDVVVMLLSLTAVAGGGRLVVGAAVTIAESMGISPVIIGLTVLSIGTTLPELTTSILAARRGYSDLAIGNAVGSCIFNILFIGGAVAVIHPIDLPSGGRGDTLAFLAMSLVLLPMIVFDRGEKRIGRLDGTLLLLGYVGYTTYRALTALV